MVAFLGLRHPGVYNPELDLTHPWILEGSSESYALARSMASESYADFLSEVKEKIKLRIGRTPPKGYVLSGQTLCQLFDSYVQDSQA